MNYTTVYVGMDIHKEIFLHFFALPLHKGAIRIHVYQSGHVSSCRESESVTPRNENNVQEAFFPRLGQTS